VSLGELDEGVEEPMPCSAAVDRQHRIAQNWRARGPYFTGASTPVGAAARVRCPQAHSRSIS
jgi:hypothetical protein